jgi:formylglycine-generating enzyme required for sulfatase activity
MNKYTHKFLLALSMLTALTVVRATLPVVSNVVATQRTGTKLVDISYDVADADGDALKIRVEVSDNAGTKYSVPAFSFTGDIGDNITPGSNKTIVWDAGVDWDGEYSDQMRVKVIAVDGRGLPGLEWGSEVPAGGFLLGQDGGAEGSGPSRHVNIPWSYWLSKYEITNEQYAEFLNTALISGEVVRNGTLEVWAVENKFDGIPADALLLKIGDEFDVAWNVNNFEVVTGMENRPVCVTWYGALAFAQHYGYDLPTVAEWEKVARGPDHDDEDEHQVYPWGDNMESGYANYRYNGGLYDGTKSPVGYFDGNQTPIGPDMANAHGLYDLIGNLGEWTRTQSFNVESYPNEESLDASIHSYLGNANRVYKGGSFINSGSLNQLMIYSNYSKSPSTIYTWSSGFFDLGFRVIRRTNP